MIISHKDATLNKTNSVLNAYYKSLKNSEVEVRTRNDNLQIYQKQLNSAISKINTALNNYYMAARTMYMLANRIATILNIGLDWSDLGINATTYNEVINYDLSK